MEKNDKTILKAIVGSIISTLVVLAVVSVLIVVNKSRVAQFLGYTEQNNAISSGDSDSIVTAVKKSNPAVVAIVITKDEPIFERFYGNYYGIPVPQSRQKGTQKVEVGGGSGFLVSHDGYIVTNGHVVNDSSAEYTVYTNDGKKHSAKVIAVDPTQDIAFIRIQGSGYPFLTFGDSKKLELGQTVVAIGNALGEFRNTVSAGVVSGLSRSIVAGDMIGNAEQLDEVIQTDAAINPGNSGGPLLDLHGNVVGVNVAVAAGSQNIGFALPADGIAVAVESVRTFGKIIHPYIGIRYIPINETVQADNKLTVDYGVLVDGGDSGQQAVVPGSPAQKAGIAEGDIVLTFNGVKITADKSLSSLIRTKKVGDTVTLTVLREGKEKAVTLVLAEFPLN